jgi:hypothetical protein
MKRLKFKVQPFGKPIGYVYFASMHLRALQRSNVDTVVYVVYIYRNRTLVNRNWYDRVPLWFIMTYVLLNRQIHTTI